MAWRSTRRQDAREILISTRRPRRPRHGNADPHDLRGGRREDQCQASEFWFDNAERRPRSALAAPLSSGDTAQHCRGATEPLKSMHRC